EDWCKMPVSEVVLNHVQEFQKCNRFMYFISSLSNSVWTTVLTLSVGYGNVRGDGYRRGRQDEFGQPILGKTATQCRRCRAENETLPHVFGSCPYGEALRRARHDKLKHRLTALLTKQGLHCQEEVHCTDENGSTRFIDIVAIDPNSSQAFIVDPTIRYETNSDIGKEVQ